MSERRETENNELFEDSNDATANIVWYCHQGPTTVEINNIYSLRDLVLPPLLAGDIIEVTFSASGYGNCEYYTKVDRENLPVKLLCRGRRRLETGDEEGYRSMFSQAYFLVEEPIGGNTVVIGTFLKHLGGVTGKVTLLGYSTVIKIIR